MRRLRIQTGCALSALVLCSAISLTAQTPAPADQAAPRVAKPAAKLPAARDVIERHVKAIGGREAVLSHTSTKASGTIEVKSVGLTGSLEVFAARPNKLLSRVTLPGVGEIQEGFNGVVGWSISALTGPTLLDGKQLEQRKFDSDYYDQVRASEKYESMTTVEQTEFDGRPCYKLRLVRRGGGEDFAFYDVKTGLKAGSVMTREMPMGSVTGTTVESNYRKFGNVLMATQLKQSAMGVETLMIITAVEHDAVDAAVFEPPAQIKALIK
jgi:hypothetical protein